MNVMQMYDEDVKNANGDVPKLEVIYRSKWLYLHRGQAVSTVHNPAFQSWSDFIVSFLKKP